MNLKTNYFLLIILILISILPVYYFSRVSKEISNFNLNISQLAQVSSLDGGLISHYKFDDGSGTTAINSVGGNNGTLVGGPVFTSGKVGSGALSFDGADDYVSAGDVNALDNVSQLSLSYWINPSSLQLRDYHVSKANGANSIFGWAVHATDDTDDIRFETRNPAGTLSDAYTTGSFLKANAWSHVVVVFDGTQADNISKLKIFIDGSQKSLTFRGTIPSVLPDTAFNLVLGWEHNRASGFSFGGMMDDVRIYNRTLSDSEVTELYSNQPITPPVQTNQAPVVSAGSNQTITLPSSLSLNGSASDDGLPTGSSLSYLWSFVSGPGSVNFSNSSSLITTATFSQAGNYVLRLTTSDSALSSGSDITITVNPEVVVPPLDITPPSVPLNLSASVISTSQINLSWDASSDNVLVSGYKIYRDNVEISSVSNTSFQDTGLSQNTSYSYSISSYDSSNNLSAKSGSVTAKTLTLVVDSPPVTNNNLLNNSSFETPGDNFWGFGGSKITENELSTDAVHGMYSLKWPYINTANDLPTNSPYSSEYQNTLSYQPVGADAGSTYTLSASMKYVLGGGQVEYQIYDSTRGRSGFGLLLAKSPKFTLTTTWKRFDWTFTLPSSSNGEYVIRIVFPGVPPGQNPYPASPIMTGMVDAIKFEKGNLTDYTTDPIEVGMYPESEFNTFQWGADTSVGVYVANNSSQAFVDTVDLTLEDFFGNTVTQKSVSFNVPSAQRVRQNTSFGTNLRGHYRILARVNGVIKSEKVFSTIPTSRNINPVDSIYGIDTNLNLGSMKLVKKLGITRLRPHGDLSWAAVEKTNDNFVYPDYRINRAKSMGLQPYGFLHITPSWAGPSTTRLPNSLSDWEDFVYNIVNHYKNDIKEWEIYNETYSVDPSNGIQHMTGPEYLSLVQAAERGASRADPSAKLVGWSGTVPPISGQNYSYKDVKDQLIQKLSILSAHYYPTHDGLTGTRFYDTLKNHTQVISGGSMKVWNTEGGALGGPTFYKTKSDYDPADSRNDQTADVSRLFANHKAAESPLYYYWLNFPSTGDHSPGYSYSWTLNEYDTSLKASAVAIANSAYFLDGANIRFKGHIAKGDYVDDESVVMMQFTKDTNSSVLIAWTDVPGKTVVIENSSLPASVTINDMFGKVLSNSSTGQRFSFTLSNNPVYILVNSYNPDLVDRNFFKFGLVASNDSILISETVNGDKNPMRVRIFGSESSNPGSNDLLFSQDVANGGTVTYPWDATLHSSDANTLVLYHFDNRKDIGENLPAIKDFSSNNRNGTLVSSGGSTLEFGDSYGKFGGGLKGGGSQFARSVMVPNDSGLNNLSQFTIEMWLKSSSLSGSTRLFSKGDIDSYTLINSPYAGRIRETGKELIFQVSDGTITRKRYGLTKSPFPTDNTYHHVAFVFDGSGFQQELRKMDIYLDGKNINGLLTGREDGKCPVDQVSPSPSCQIPSFTKIDANSLYLLGFSGNGSLFNGYMDEFVMYNRALSPEEIYNHYILSSNKTYYWFTEFIGDKITKTAIKNSKQSFPNTNVDTTSPVISGVNVSNVSSNSATISFITNELADSQIEYGLTPFYGNKTVLNSNLSSMHSETLTGLNSNTVYHFRVLSKDGFDNLANSTSGTFTTLKIEPSVSTNLDNSVGAGGTGAGVGVPLSDTGTTTRPNLPFGNTATSTRVDNFVVPNLNNATGTVYQVNLNRDLKLGQIGTDVKELQKILNDLGYTVSLSGPGSKGNETSKFGFATESALRRFQCSVMNICSGPSYGTLDQKTIEVIRNKVKIPSATKNTSYIFSKILKLGMKGEDVKQLQVFLNNNGFTVSVSGPGSKGNESTYFGPATMRAVIKFQEAYAKDILTPSGLKKGTGLFGNATIKKVNSLVK